MLILLYVSVGLCGDVGVSMYIYIRFLNSYLNYFISYFTLITLLGNAKDILNFPNIIIDFPFFAFYFFSNPINIFLFFLTI